VKVLSSKIIREKFIFLSFIFITVVGGYFLIYQQPYRVVVTYQGYKEDKILQIRVKEVDINASSFNVLNNVTPRDDEIQNIDFNVSFFFITYSNYE